MSSPISEAIEVLTKELESALSAYESAEKVATMKEMAVKAAKNELDIANKNTTACVNRYDMILNALNSLSGKCQVSKLELKINSSSVDTDAALAPSADAPVPAYAVHSLSPVFVKCMNEKALCITDPERDSFLRGVVRWYLSYARGCDLYKINAAVCSFFESKYKAGNWLDNLIYNAMRNGVVTRIRRGTYRLSEYSEVRSGGGTYRVASYGCSIDTFLEVAPGLEGNKAALENMILSTPDFKGFNICNISVDVDKKIISVKIK